MKANKRIIKDFKVAEAKIRASRINMAECISILHSAGYSFKDIAGLLNKNSAQAVYLLYRYHYKH